MSLDEKWDKDRRPLEPVKNENLVCKTCEHRTSKVSSCVRFYTKPVSVLKGGVCNEYKKQ